METRRHTPMEELGFFKEYVAVSDWAWRLVHSWTPFARDTIGKQLVRAVDSVGANLVEGDGRYSDGDAAHFFTIARASARETRFWIERAVARDLIPTDQAHEQIGRLTEATRQLNAIIRYRRQTNYSTRVRDVMETYTTGDDDPFYEIDPFDNVG